jgi:two-component system sensor histidine kinase/response regulator
VDFLYKPIEPHILENKADVYFRLYRQKQQLAQQLREQTETLHLNEMFMAVLGHDLRNPLSAILMAAHMVQHQSADETVRATAKRILLSGKRMGRMIDDMLDLARARLGGGIPLKASQAELAEPVQRVVREYEIAFPERRIELQQHGDLIGEWDADRLAQVASNLIGNALQHGEPSGSVQGRLVGTRAEGIVLSVLNVGTIPPSVMTHLFEPFQGARRQPG